MDFEIMYNYLRKNFRIGKADQQFKMGIFALILSTCVDLKKALLHTLQKHCWM